MRGGFFDALLVRVGRAGSGRDGAALGAVSCVPGRPAKGRCVARSWRGCGVSFRFVGGGTEWARTFLRSGDDESERRYTCPRIDADAFRGCFSREKKDQACRGREKFRGVKDVKGIWRRRGVRKTF